MSKQNKKTLSVVFILIVFVMTAFLFSQTNPQTITMRDYVDMKIDSLEKLMLMRFNEFQKAIEKAYLTNEIDKAKMNEIRGALSDANKMFATEESVERIRVDVRDLRSIADIAKGKASQGQFLVSLIASFIGMIGGVVGIISKFKSDKGCNDGRA